MGVGMFDDNNQTLNTSTAAAPSADPATAPVATPAVDATAPTLPAADQSFNASVLPADPVAPTTDPMATPSLDITSPATATDTASPTVTPSSTPAASDDLLSIKQDALQNLTPLLSHLDQTPEEKFRTTMMLIQASDDQSLVQTAYAAAKEISDEKIRAQAILDIVNEINYFTQQQKPAA